MADLPCPRGPYYVLADLGADVIRSSLRGDDTRRGVPPVSDSGVGTY